MSLLLEALKKAEKAKEEAQRRAGDTPPAEDKAVRTRAELPDIKQPLEILSEEISPKEPQPAQAPAPRAGLPPQAAERAVAKKVFEVKFKEPNPRMPFYATMGALGVFALCTVAYFWYQLRPPQPWVNASPPPAQQAPVGVAAAAAPAPLAVAAQSAIPGLPPAPAKAPIPAAAMLEPKRVAPQPEEAAPPPRPAAPRVSRPAPQPASPVATSRPAAPPRVHPKVEAAYAAYLKGDLESARSDYQDALREDASNRDALLGLAAINVRTGRLEVAEATYLRALQLDPGDAHAQAGLIALRAARLDPLATESRVKSMLAADPGANVLHFTLGNQLAQQGRWGEAQQEYFKAFSAHPENADFAYNLAVSLDHVRQGKLALEYYRRAVALAETRGASFDIAAARARSAQLEK
jgi:tetratricopeptide (TPR) repeat protein